LHFISFHENSGTELNHMNCTEPHAKLYHMNKLLSPCCLSWYSTNLIGYGKGNPNSIEWKTNILELLVLEHKEFLIRTLDSWFICFVDIFFLVSLNTSWLSSCMWQSLLLDSTRLYS
jgi:hypothetical protein